jgi:hypothetical protein
MLDDRKPTTQVSIDEDAHAEEFEVYLSRREVMAITNIDISHCRDVEPWLRVVDRDGQLITFAGVSVIPDED